MQFSFVSLFEGIINSYFKYSILGKAVENNHIKVHTYNPRDFTKNKHNQVDDTLYGGGNGMLLNVEPIINTLEYLKDTHIIFLTPCAKLFTQNDAKRLSKKKHITFVCGRYEGFDERSIELMANEVFSVGDYVLTGGELASLSLCDAISRYIDGVISKDALVEESFNDNTLEYPSFTKPKKINNLSVPSVLLNGNHAKISTFKKSLAKIKTKYHRVDLYQRIKNEK